MRTGELIDGFTWKGASVRRVARICCALRDRIIGIITYEVFGNMCEIVSLDSFEERKGIGTKLVDCVLKVAEEEQCRQIWLITTNDNMNALRFYQKRNFVMTHLYVNAVERHENKERNSTYWV